MKYVEDRYITKNSKSKISCGFRYFFSNTNSALFEIAGTDRSIQKGRWSFSRVASAKKGSNPYNCIFHCICIYGNPKIRVNIL